MELYKKLLESKKEIGKISKDSTNPFFKSKYFDINSLLEHVEPILQKNGLLLLQPLKEGFVSTEIYDAESGESIGSSIQLPNLSDPQKLGSAITYYRRYTLQSLLGLQAEDDDANAASKPPKMDLSRLNARLEACTTIEQLATVYKGFTKQEQTATVNKKDELKEKLSKKAA